MANSIRSWVKAARLRTLPLSISGIIVGTAMAASEGFFNANIFLLALLTNVGFKILSNFANDYGDGVKGTDNEDRVGPQRALQSGEITKRAMKQGIVITTMISLFLAIWLIYISFGKDNVQLGILFLLLGLASVVAAIKYTVGDSAYGYHGLGDVFVFLFFGLLSVCGSFFLYTKQLDLVDFLPAVTVGFFSTAVLNLNNMRDIDNDEKVGKRTLAVMLGPKQARAYHYMLIFAGMLASIAYVFIRGSVLWNALFIVSYIPLALHMVKVLRTEAPQLLDPELKKVALSTFLFSVLFFIGFNIFS